MAGMGCQPSSLGSDPPLEAPLPASGEVALSPAELQWDQPAYRESGLSTVREEARYQAASSWVPGALVEPFQEKLTQNRSELVPDSRGYVDEGSLPSLRLARRVGQRTEVGWVVQSLQG